MGTLSSLIKVSSLNLHHTSDFPVSLEMKEEIFSIFLLKFRKREDSRLKHAWIYEAAFRDRLQFSVWRKKRILIKILIPSHIKIQNMNGTWKGQVKRLDCGP